MTLEFIVNRNWINFSKNVVVFNLIYKQQNETSKIIVFGDSSSIKTSIPLSRLYLFIQYFMLSFEYYLFDPVSFMTKHELLTVKSSLIKGKTYNQNIDKYCQRKKGIFIRFKQTDFSVGSIVVQCNILIIMLKIYKSVVLF